MTIKEIAEKSGVSIGTVDRVVHQRDGVCEETRRRVQAIIDQSGYKPNTYARNLKLGKHYHIAVLLPYLQSESRYWDLVASGILKAAQELESFNVVVEIHQFHRESTADFLALFQSVMATHPEAVLLPPPNSESMKKIKTMEDLPPVCLIDSAYPDFPALSTIAQNAYRGGFVAGKISRLLTGSSGRYLCLQIHPDAYNSRQRAAGFRANLEGQPGNQVTDVVFPTEQALPGILDGVFAEHQDIRGIFVTSSITGAVASYLVSRGKKQNVVLVGYDLVPENRKALEDGGIDCIISQRPAYQGYTGVYQLYKQVVLQQTPEPNVHIPIDIFFKENLVDTID
ncbi:MAG: LacI family DNA-binding transcriptional regulator [Sphaerochaeta sp.]|jgi:LacI family transcriptional regulator|nr:LacI family DNA-binding transcriptional regulator [Sphaerochaeta sp.]MCI2076400.1 LacI family DNA-binding transcriptional regulator [Sphaerochaeta sp.]MCI2096596.1 LacI family DNA-binding transcriptional regulator [Sphaerochaeta sp.]